MDLTVSTFKDLAFDPAHTRIGGVTDALLDDVRRNLEAGHLIVVNGVFEAAMVDRVRSECFGFFGNPDNERNDGKIAPGVPDFFRTYENPPKSAVKSVARSAFYFYWNPAHGAEQDMFRAVSEFRNRLAGYRDAFSVGEIDDGWTTIPTITQYPAGGGSFNMHVDPRSRNFCNILVSMTTRGRDFDEGGLFLELAGKLHSVDDHIETGDVYLFRPDIPHGIAPVDPGADKGPAWGSAGGRWVMIPALGELQGYAGTRVDGYEEVAPS